MVGDPVIRAGPRPRYGTIGDVSQCVPVVNRCVESRYGGNSPPLLKFRAMGVDFLGLLDSGSSVSLLGDAGVALCKERGVTTKRCQTLVRFGRGNTRVAGSVRLIMRFPGGKRRQRFLLVPGLSPAVILGRDFLVGTDMDLRISAGGWTCGSFPQKVVPFDSEGDPTVSCLVSSSVSPSARTCCAGKLHCQRETGIGGNSLGIQKRFHQNSGKDAAN